MPESKWPDDWPDDWPEDATVGPKFLQELMRRHPGKIHFIDTTEEAFAVLHAAVVLSVKKKEPPDDAQSG